jgi:predicted MPP superfamily phosphohydrolase
MNKQAHPSSNVEPALASSGDAILEKRLELAYQQENAQPFGPRLISRRSLMWMIGGLLGTSVVGAGYARFVEPAHMQIDLITLTIAGLPAQLAGKRIAQISDIHVGAYFRPEDAAAAIQRVNQLGVDLLMLTGDFVTVRERDRSRRSELRTQALMSLVEPLRLAQMPMAAVSGNHDHWGGVDPVVRMLNEAGVRLLRNEATPIDDGLWLAGVEDVWGGRPDLGAALRDVPAGETTLLMSHSPDYFDNVIQRDAPIAAQFSGHTHGGQVRLPRPTPGPDGLFSYALIVPEYGKRYPIGLRRVGERVIYTNRGLGSWPIPYRFNCPPEITVFTLQQA